MKFVFNCLILIIAFIFIGCASQAEEKESSSFKLQSNEKIKSINSTSVSSIKIDLNNKGIGPITSIELDPEINQSLMNSGKDLYNKLCITCHRAQKKFTGPPLSGVLERRSPEWVMNMILNPEEMTKKDPIAKELSQQFLSAPMIRQFLSQDDARAIVEFLRIYK